MTYGDNITYEEARHFIEEAGRYGSRLGLETIAELLSRFDNPQDELNIIHIAGTNGKGSTAAFIASILAAAGYKTGRYISPAVFTYREKIQISAKRQKQAGDLAPLKTEYITKQGICDTIAAIRPVCEAMVKEGFFHPTSFELETAMAMLYFRRERVDFAVVEAGLGGRLDATNAVKRPVCSVITSVSMDHMQYLGGTPERIAKEKAGIIKDGSPVVTCNKSPEVLRVLEQACRVKKAPLTLAGMDEVRLPSFSPEETSFCYRGEKYTIRLLGRHQIANAVLAVQTAAILRQSGYPVSAEAVKSGLLKTKWSGRFEVISKAPYFILDGAHNEDAAYKLADAIRLYFAGRRIIFVMGVFADKDYRRILCITAPLAELIITLTPNSGRALASSELAKEAKKYCPAVLDANTAKQAVLYAYREAKAEDVIIAFGSLSFLGELRTCVTRTQRLSRAD